MKNAITILAAALVFLNACAAPRPAPVKCDTRHFTATKSDPTLVSQSADTPLAPVMTRGSAFETGTMRQILQQPETQRAGPIEIELLALSAGGQFGAFGAGFLRGWSENRTTPRPEFELVTGVSAGAIIAPVVFAGSAFDPALDGYRGLSERDVFRSRPFFALPTAPSAAAVEPLERFISDRLTDDLIAEIAARHTDGNGLFILATDLDGTEAVIFDLGQLAALDQPVAEKRACLTEAMLASSAIPGLFPPRNIDGALLGDGGLRDQIFLSSVETVREDLARASGRDVRVSATLIVNGALRPPGVRADDGLLGYARRGALILADEVLRTSIEDVVRFAQGRPNWTIRGVIADTDLSKCGDVLASGTFDPCVTEALFDDGRQKGATTPVPWLAPEALLELAGAL